MKETLSFQSSSSACQANAAAMMFCLGLNAMFAQIIMTRELMVAFYGNELVIGIIFAVWLLMVSAGSLVIRPFLSGLTRISHRRKPPARHALLPQRIAAKVSARCWRTLLKIALRRDERQTLSKPRFRDASKPFRRISHTRCEKCGLSEKGLCFLAAVLLVASAIALPLLIFAARALRIFFGVPMGEYMALMPMLAGAFLVLAPICLVIGIVFPIACRLSVLGNGNVAGIYAAESAGSMAAGMIFSFVFVYLLPPLGAAMAAVVGGICGAALVAPSAFLRRICWLAALGLAVLLIFSGPINALEMKGIKLRWESFGILPRSGAHAPGQPRLVDSRDSRYQNLALIESEGQQTLYGNGQVMFVFPDEIFAEQKIHFIMAQKPDARRVLLIGGSPVNDIPELLKYPLTSLAHVELDALINDMLADTGGDRYRRALSDPRLRQCLMDGPRFVKNSRETFDVIIVEAPEPTTVALNRFYTVEFYRAISRILAPGGFLYTAVNSSEQMQDEAASITASVYRALETVFRQTLVTAGPRNQFFAGKKDARLTFDGKILYERWSSAGIKTKYFRPEYFLNADEISADKTDFVRRRISSVSVPANSALKPISAFYSLSLWSRYSDSRLEHLFNLLGRMRIEWVGGALAASVVLFLIFVVILLGQKTAQAVARSERIIIWAVIAATGFTGMAFELVLIFMFQTLLGYIYASIGLIIAMFMLGLAMGAWSVRKYSLTRPEKCWMLLLGLDAVLLLTAISLPFLMEHDWGCSVTWPVAGAIYFLTLLTGWAGGAQFILAVDLLDSDSKIVGAPSRETRDKLVYHADSVVGARPEGGHTPARSLHLSANGKSGTEQDRGENKHTARNAALLNAVDLAGAALGGISIGIIFLPLFGFAGTCYLLAILKTGTLSLLGAFLYFNTRYFVSERR